MKLGIADQAPQNPKTPAQLRLFHKIIELGATSNEEIAAWCLRWKPEPGCPSFGGVFSNDTLTAPKKDTIYILNLQNANEGGSHWTLLCNGNYFDSYGVVPTKRIAKFTKQYNKEDYQGLTRDSCGHFSCYVAWHLMHGLPSTGDLIPSRTTHNEDVLERFFYA